MPRYCFWNLTSDIKETNSTEIIEQAGINFCLIYAAVFFQYILFCLLLLAILLRCCCNRRKKRKRTKSFTLPDERGEENVIPTSCDINNENFELGKWRKDNNKRVSDAYSVIRFTESSNMYTTSIADDDQKNANNPYSRVKLLRGNKPSSSHEARNNSVLLEESTELSSPPPIKPPQHELEDTPPIPKPRNSMILKTSNFNPPTQQQAPPGSCTKQETLTITPEIDISNLPPLKDNDGSSTYSMAGQCNEDGESQGSVHYSTISRSSADIYSLADSNADIKEPADYEDFYSVARDGIEEVAYTMPHRELPTSAKVQGRDSATTTTITANEGSSKELPEKRLVIQTPHAGRQSRTVRGTRENVLLFTSGDSRKRSLSAANMESQHEPVAAADPSLHKNASFRTNKQHISPHYVNI